MKVTMIGTGYVGLVQGAVLADAGHEVVCVDVDAAKIAKLEQGIIPIHEPGLDSVVRATYAAGRLAFTTSYAEGLKRAEVAFIAVGTPPGENGSADLTHVLGAARSIGKHMTGYCVIVDKSTVPVGTASKVMQALRESTTHDFDVVSNPEFLKEGAAIDDFMKPDRVVIGSASKRAAEVMETFTGLAEVHEWLSITPKGITFSLDGDVEQNAAGHFCARYKLEVEDFVGGGSWTFQLTDGLISWLTHQPESFDELIEELPREERHKHDHD